MSNCPVTGHTLPSDGSPLSPSAFFGERRQEGPAHPLRYADGHLGRLITDYDLARAVLSDHRFSQSPRRFPLGPSEPATDVVSDDERALATADLLTLDGDRHQRIRKTITKRFSIKAVRAHRETIQRIVAEELANLLDHATPADLTESYAEPISARVHAHVLGIPQERIPDYVEAYVRGGSAQLRFDFVRSIIEHRRAQPGDDVISDLLESELTEDEVFSLTAVLMTSGRDSVAYTIVTTTVALLTNSEQRQHLIANPELASAAVEEYLRFGTMFVALFPRTATEDLEIDGVAFRAGESVSVSPVSANRDAQRFPDPDRFDVTRDAYGHLGFGFGPHSCLGQQLARAEIGEAIGALLTKVPTLELVEAQQLGPMPFAHVVPTYQAGSLLVTW